MFGLFGNKEHKVIANRMGVEIHRQLTDALEDGETMVALRLAQPFMCGYLYGFIRLGFSGSGYDGEKLTDKYIQYICDGVLPKKLYKIFSGTLAAMEEASADNQNSFEQGVKAGAYDAALFDNPATSEQANNMFCYLTNKELNLSGLEGFEELDNNLEDSDELDVIIQNAEQGKVESQLTLGQMYFDGDGVRQNYGTSFKWYSHAATQGHMNAQEAIGKMHESGLGIPINQNTAIKWYTLAAEQGNSRAQFWLAEKYRLGEGVLENYETAIKWGKLAAEQGDDGAQVMLGNIYSDPSMDLIKQDYEAAMKWYRLAAEQGNSDGQLRLGMMYGSGEGVTVYPELAELWLRRSAGQGNIHAAMILGED